MSAEDACGVDDLRPGEVLRVDLPSGTAVALVRDAGGEFHALADCCSHGQVSLSDGEVDGTTIECWLHGSTFDLRTGAPLTLPATKPVPVYPVTVADGRVLVDASTRIN